MGKMALRTAGLTKRYGRAVVLGGLDLKVGASQVHAFLGPNGAGPPASDQDPPGSGNVFRTSWPSSYPPDRFRGMRAANGPFADWPRYAGPDWPWMTGRFGS
jgi:ABC-2 type transport system ATP-binding protein